MADNNEQNGLQDEQAVADKQNEGVPATEEAAEDPVKDKPLPPVKRQLLIETDGVAYHLTFIHTITMLELQSILGGLLGTVNRQIDAANRALANPVPAPAPQPAEEAEKPEAPEEQNDG